MRTAAIMPTLAKPGWDRHLPSLLSQTAPADEIIVVVDRPTTAEEQAAIGAAAPAVRFLFNERNIGITASLNRALHATDADVIFRVDDDDESYPERFARQLACFDETGADIVATWAEGVAEGDESRPYLIRCPTSDAEIKAVMPRRNVLVHPTLAFRRDAVLAIGGYDETFVNAQDYALYLAAIRGGLSFAAVPTPLVRRHYAKDNITVKRRYHQLMYSCAARVVHCAHSGDRVMLLRTLAHYAALAAIPNWARVARRRLFRLIGKGA